MKKHLLSILCLLLAFPAFGQQHASAVSFLFDWSKDGVVVQSENRDYCDYYGYLEFTNLVGYIERGGSAGAQTIPPGKKKLMTLVKDPTSSGASYRHRYQLYRGSLIKKVNPDFVYALPVKAGDSIRVAPANSSMFTSIFNLRHASDTIYACREGRVCDDKLTDTVNRTVSTKNKLIIYHKDGSFGEYTQYNEALVHPGDYVEMGQPVAIVKANDKGSKSVAFSVYYLDKNKVKNSETGQKHSTIVPLFHSANHGDGKLEDKTTTYIGELTEDLIIQEMSKKDKEKYLKNKAKESEKKNKK